MKHKAVIWACITYHLFTKTVSCCKNKLSVFSWLPWVLPYAQLADRRLGSSVSWWKRRSLTSVYTVHRTNHSWAHRDWLVRTLHSPCTLHMFLLELEKSKNNNNNEKHVSRHAPQKSSDYLTTNTHKNVSACEQSFASGTFKFKTKLRVIRYLSHLRYIYMSCTRAS